MFPMSVLSRLEDPRSEPAQGHDPREMILIALARIAGWMWLK
jgi:hypothetical protein